MSRLSSCRHIADAPAAKILCAGSFDAEQVAIEVDVLKGVLIRTSFGACKLAAFKPDPATYQGVAQVFDVAPGEVMLVAAHQDELAHARAAELKTAYIERPLEYGISQRKDVSANLDNTFHAKDLIQLAERLGC